MILSKKLLTLLAIICVIASAGFACAADEGGYAGSNYVDDMSVDTGYDDVAYDDSQYDVGYDDVNYDGGWAGSQYEDGGYAGSQYQDDGGWAGSQYNETLENATAANQTAAQNATSNDAAPVAANATNETSVSGAAVHNMLATGNPLIILFAACAVAGGYTFLRKN